MVHKIIKTRELAWKTGLRSRADNPDYIFDEMNALKKELGQDHPHADYMREKVRHISKWVDEIEKFQYG